MNTAPNAPTFNPLPTIVWILALPIIAVEAVLSFGEIGIVGNSASIGWRINAITDYGMSPEVVHWMLETGRYPTEHMLRFVTYPFVHYNFTSALFSLVFLLALGNMVGRVFRPSSIVAIYFGSAIIGAVAYGVISDSGFILAGGFPANYGLIGAYTFVLWVNLVATGGPRHQAFTLIGFLMGIQLFFGVFFGGAPDWIADLTGFVAGFALSFLLVPGGWQRVIALMRDR